MTKPIENCGDCSGLKARVTGIGAILLALCGLHGVTIVQGYNIRAEVAKEIARLDRQDQAQTYRLDSMEKSVTRLEDKVASLEK